jgi:hypothetical protein
MLKYFVVNTNRRADPSGYDESTMLNQEIVALYFDGYKEKIERLSEGDLVFLYSNKLGIVAYGEVTGKMGVKSYRDMPKFKGQEYYRPLKKFIKLSQPASPEEIKEVLGKRLSFARAFFEMDEKFAIPLLAHLSEMKKGLKVA